MFSGRRPNFFGVASMLMLNRKSTETLVPYLGRLYGLQREALRNKADGYETAEIRRHIAKAKAELVRLSRIRRA